MLCFGDTVPVEEEDQEILSAWQSKCGTRVSVTTPVWSTQTSIGNDQDQQCISVWSAALSYNSLSERSCSGLFTTAKQEYLTCKCQPNMISLGYVRSVIGNTSCHRRPATLTNMWEYKFCPNFWSVISPLANVRI